MSGVEARCMYICMVFFRAFDIAFGFVGVVICMGGDGWVSCRMDG